jgi:hypothetical protein
MPEIVSWFQGAVSQQDGFFLVFFKCSWFYYALGGAVFNKGIRREGESFAPNRDGAHRGALQFLVVFHGIKRGRCA